MNSPKSTLLEQLDRAHVAPAPVDELLSAGRAAKRRQRRVVVGGVTAVALVVLGGSVAVQSLVGGSDRTVSPVNGASAAEELDVRIITGDLPLFANRPVGEPMGSRDVQAAWDADAGTLTYISNVGYSGSCPPTGTATINPDGAVNLIITETSASPGVICTADAQRVAAVLKNVPREPTSLSVTDDGDTREVRFVIMGPGLMSIPTEGASGVGQTPSRSELVGTWRPLNLLGEDLRHVRNVNGNRNVIAFSDDSADLAWTAYEGCNWTSGTARLSEAGVLVATSSTTTTRGCVGPGADREIANAEVIERTTKVLLNGDVLRLYTSTGELLGEYQRTHPGL